MVSLQATSNEIAAVKNYEGCWVTKLVNVSSTFFVKLRADSYFLGLLTLLRYYNSLFREYGERKHDTTMCFFFLTLDIVLTISTPEKLPTSQEDLLSHLKVKLMDKDNFS